MTVQAVDRKAGVYTANGTTTTFTFAFKLILAEHLVVTTSTDGIYSTTLKMGVDYDYTVTLNEDQDTNPGGTVTFNKAPDAGTLIAITSDTTIDQLVDLTNHDGFYPTVIVDEYDKLTIICQELKELLSRCLMVNATSKYTPDDYMALLENFIDKYDEMMALPDELQKLYEELYEQAQKDMQAIIDELEKMRDEIEEGWGIMCRQVSWEITEDTPAGTVITIPDDKYYIVGHYNLRLSWNGLSIYQDDGNFEEIGERNEKSTQFKILFPLEKGDVLNAWIIPLGTGETTDMWAYIEEVQQNLNKLAEKVVYYEDV